MEVKCPKLTFKNNNDDCILKNKYYFLGFNQITYIDNIENKEFIYFKYFDNNNNSEYFINIFNALNFNNKYYSYVFDKIKGHIFKLSNIKSNTNNPVKKLINIGSKIKYVEFLPYSEIKSNNASDNLLFSQNITTGFFIKYENGDTCIENSNLKYSSIVFLLCENSNNIHSPQYLNYDNKKCLYHFLWKHKSFCSFCTNKILENLKFTEEVRSYKQYFI